jgi:hypothetical protein
MTTENSSDVSSAVLLQQAEDMLKVADNNREKVSDAVELFSRALEKKFDSVNLFILLCI